MSEILCFLNDYTDNNVITWENSQSSVAHEGFEVKRKGDREFPAQIRVEMNYVPERCLGFRLIRGQGLFPPSGIM